VITLDPICHRNGVASTDDIVNMLANRAMQTSNTTTNNSTDNQHTEYHLNEVLSLLPNLQHGMDVNPKFTSGPTGIEYTNNLAAFDLLGVELVHGWLLDKQDVETMSVVEEKTYNELIELVINGNEAREKVDILGKELSLMEKKLEESAVECTQVPSDEKNGEEDQPASDNTEGCSLKDDINTVDESIQSQTKPTTEEDESVQSQTEPPLTKDKSTTKEKDTDQTATLEKDIIETREKITNLSLQITRAAVANAFLTSSGHQLTYHGLEQLHNHLGDDALCVFFRNNHFATLTKHNGILYLLVTDLGYANTPEIVWEKLDNIDGNTEHANEFFNKPKARSELKAADGPTIDPALILAQRGQTESDLQLAIAMSKGTATTQNMDNDEGALIQAAKDLSLKSYHGDDSAAVVVSEDTQVDSDHKLALAYQREQHQSEHDSEQLARQLQELEYARNRPTSTRRQPQQRRAAPAQRPAAASSNCTIS